METEEPKFRDYPLKTKIGLILMTPFVYALVIYIIIRATFDKKKREDWVAISKGETPPNEVKFPEHPGDDATEDEMDAYYQAEFDAHEEWERNNRGKVILMNIFTYVVLKPIFEVMWFFEQRKSKRV
jgi:hypothetical protein